MVLRWVIAFVALSVMACADRPPESQNSEAKKQAVSLNRIEIDLAVRGMTLSKKISPESVESESTWQYYLSTEIDLRKARAKVAEYLEAVDKLIRNMQSSSRRPIGWEVYLERKETAKIWLQALDKKIEFIKQMDSETVNLEIVPKNDVYLYHLSEETRLAYYQSALKSYEENLKKIEQARGYSLLHPPIELIERCRDVNFRNDLIRDLSVLAGHISTVRDYLRSLRGAKILAVEDRQKMLTRFHDELISVQTLQSAIIELGIDARSW